MDMEVVLLMVRSRNDKIITSSRVLDKLETILIL